MGRGKKKRQGRGKYIKFISTAYFDANEVIVFVTHNKSFASSLTLSDFYCENLNVYKTKRIIITQKFVFNLINLGAQTFLFSIMQRNVLHFFCVTINHKLSHFIIPVEVN